MNNVSTRIAQRIDTLANWESADPILLSGELAIVSTEVQTLFKVGNGTSSFTQLPFVDQTQLSTLSAYATYVSADSLVVGYQNIASAHSIAAGSNTSALAQHSIALGNKAATSSVGSFVFNGDNGYLASAYYDHGVGTFNVNAPLSDIWIQEQSLDKVLAVPAVFKTLQLVKPWSTQRLHVKIDIAADDQYSTILGTFDSTISGQLFKYFAGSDLTSQWLTCPAEGFSTEANNSPITFELGAALAALDLHPDVNTQYFTKYEWYWKDTSNVEHASDKYASVVPATTEVGANADDVINKAQFAELKALLFPDYSPVYDNDCYVLALDTYNQLSGWFEQSSKKIVLSNYTATAPYKFSLELSNGQALSAVSAQVSVYTETLAGSYDYSADLTQELATKLAEAWPTSNGQMQIDGVLVNGRFDLYVDNHLVTKATKFDDSFQWVQMVRPTNENRLHLHVEIYKDSNMLESAIGISAISADSATSPQLFKAFVGAAEEGAPAWVQISAEGTSPDMQRYPVAFDVKSAIQNANLSGFSWNPTEVKWINYWWFWNEYSNNGTFVSAHPSDRFSMPFPATTEVGANAGEAALLQDVLDLQQEVMPSYKSIEQDEDDGYICYSNVYNILSGNFDQSDAHITLKDYSESRKYRIKMHYNDVSALTSNEYADDAALSVWCGIAGVSQLSEDLTEQLVAKLSACQPKGTSSDIEANLQFERWELYVDGKLADSTSPISLQNYYQKTETSSASEISNAFDNVVSSVSVSAILTAGTPIASISVDGNETTLYAPSAESGSSSSEVPGYKLLSVELSSCTYDGEPCLCCAIENHSTTTISISSDANDIVVFLPPKPADNTSRDFIIRVEISSSTAPGFFFVGTGSESLQYDSGEDDWNVLEPGLNLVSFTETK